MKSKTIWLFCLTSFFILSLYLNPALASRDVALVLKVKGNARLKSPKRNWALLRKGKRLQGGDKVRTGEESLVAIVFTDDKSMMKIHSESEVSIKGERTKKGIRKKIFMNLGQLWARINPKGGGFQVETPSGIAAVKGTEFYLFRDATGQMTVIGIKGLVELFNDMGKVLVGKGQTGILKKGIKPQLKKTVKVNDWAKEDSDENEIQIEFENKDGVKKNLKIRYKE
ncbi:MAG: hypothetical protein GWP06_04470 [Actinobacteria bacterium]|nr:hypothetical protein [Actinomycetota bacterium]